MRLHELTKISELRRNPDQNPKSSINQVIKDQLDRHPDLMVSFTSLEKLGINPGSEHNSTPLGIYAYPAEYVVKSMGLDKEMGELPFAGEQPWVSLFTPVGRVIDLGDITDESVTSLMRPLRDILTSSIPGYDRSSHKSMIDIYNHAMNTANTAARTWWLMIEGVAREISEARGVSHISIWNWVFRRLGLHGVIDPGMSIICDWEPTQAVFFSINSVKVLARVPNRYSPDQVKTRQMSGADRQSVINLYGPHIRRSKDLETTLAWLDRMGDHASLGLVRDPSLRLDVLSERPELIKTMRRSTEKEQMVAATNLITGDTDSPMIALRLIGVDRIHPGPAAYIVVSTQRVSGAARMIVMLMNNCLEKGDTKWARKFIDQMDFTNDITQYLGEHYPVAIEYINRIKNSGITA